MLWACLESLHTLESTGSNQSSFSTSCPPTLPRQGCKPQRRHFPRRIHEFSPCFRPPSRLPTSGPQICQYGLRSNLGRIYRSAAARQTVATEGCPSCGPTSLWETNASCCYFPEFWSDGSTSHVCLHSWKRREWWCQLGSSQDFARWTWRSVAATLAST